VFSGPAEKKQIHRQTMSIGVALIFFGCFVIIYKELKNDFMVRLELDFGDIDYEFGGLSPLASTSVEQCHNTF